MIKILNLLRRFRSDERGAFGIIFAVMAIVLFATAGAVVDFTSIEQTRTRAQDALDSASLGLQPTIFESGVTAATIEPKAQALLDERLDDENVTADITTVTINASEGTLRLTADLVIPTTFVSLVGISSVRARMVSEATRKRLNIEIAMVLDNSGSMDLQSRMTNLKAAAHCAKNILLNSDCNSTATTASINSVLIGIVPFTSFVNIGTGNASKTWMDQAGTSDISNDNFDNDDNDATAFAGPLNRFALYTALTNVDWRGCVESRKYPYDTNDTTPTSATPNTLFQPEFAPDTPDGAGLTNDYLDDEPAACTASFGSCRWVQTRTKCNSSGSSCSGPTTVTSTYTAANGTTTSGPTACNCTTNYPGSNSLAVTSDNTTSVASGSTWTRTRTMQCTYGYTASGLSQRELQERQCKYVGAISTSSGKGPNQDCPTNAMTPLTNTKSVITAAINAMYPQGYTNIHQGTIWGFHMLSPTEPLTQGREYTAATYKVMIIMTDGENTYNGWNTSNMNGGSGYWAYGYSWNNPGTGGVNKRMNSTTHPDPGSEAQLIASHNTRTVETCTNVKAAGITVYTIGLSSPNSMTTAMLTGCATDASHAYFPTQSSELTAVFTEIASQLADLRLAK